MQVEGVLVLKQGLTQGTMEMSEAGVYSQEQTDSSVLPGEGGI